MSSSIVAKLCKLSSFCLQDSQGGPIFAIGRMAYVALILSVVSMSSLIEFQRTAHKGCFSKYLTIAPEVFSLKI
jgi:hypothetical protein